MRRSFLRRTASFGLIALLLAGPASKSGSAQMAPSGPPAVGVVEAARRPVTESYEFMGRVQARDRVELIARVPAFLEEQFFTEGAEVKKGDLLYRLEQPPYQADLEAKQAAIAQAEAQLKNAEIQLHRAAELLKGPAGSKMLYDDALTEKLSAEAKLRAAQAAAHQSQINLDYTEIRAPVDGRISRTSVTIGNVVGPLSSTLATIVSQDPMYVTFSVPTRTAVDLRNRYVVQGGFNAVAIEIRLPDGRMYGQPGTIDFADVTISPDTDTLTVRGTIPNPVLSNLGVAGTSIRELTDGEFVTVVVESSKSVEQITVPREAVLSDQRGDFVYVVDANNNVERRAVQLGQSTSVTAAIAAGLTEGERVVLEGVQRVQPGMKVAPGPADVDSHAVDVPPASRS
jgi:membrane fusion protein (multidrug efflux system)